MPEFCFLVPVKFLNRSPPLAAGEGPSRNVGGLFRDLMEVQETKK